MSVFSPLSRGRLSHSLFPTVVFLAILMLQSVQAGVSGGLTVTINQQATQADPMLLNGTTATKFLAVFSAPVTPGSFTVSDVRTSGSTATDVVVQSVTEIAPMDGTTFEIVASATGAGTIVLSIPGDGVDYTAITPLTFSTPSNPYQVAAEGDKVYVGTYNGGGLYEIDGVANTRRLFNNLSGDAAFGTVLARDGFIYCLGYQTANQRIYRFTPDGTRTTLLTASGLRYFTVDSLGNVYFTNGSNSISRITPAGVLDSSWVTVTDALPAGYMPGIDSQDNLYLTTSGGSKIIKVTPTGVVSTVATGIVPSGGNQSFKTYDGELYVLNQLAPDSMQTIKKIDEQGNIIIVFDSGKSYPGTVFSSISDFEMLPDGRLLISLNTKFVFIYDASNNTHQVISTPTTVPVLGHYAISEAGIYMSNNAGSTYKLANAVPVPTATDLNGNSSAASTSTDNVVTLKSAAEMQAIAQAKIVAYANDNTNPAPTVEDYGYIGVTGVTVENLAIVNVFVDASTGADVDTTPEVQALVDMINAALAAVAAAQDAIIAYANDPANPAPTLADYQTIGTVGVTADNLAMVNARVDALSGPDVDTAPEVQALVDGVNAAAAKIVAYANDNTNPAPTVTDYQVISVTGVTTDNLAAVNAQVDALTGPDVDTTPEVQALVDTVNAAQAKIVAYANDNTQPAPTVDDYADAGVTGVTTDNLAAVNAQVDALTGPDVDTTPEVQALVDTVNAAQAKIVAYANDHTQPAPTVDDYADVGVTGVTAANLALVNGSVDVLSGPDVDTRPEVQAVVDAVNLVMEAQARIVAYANDNTQPAPTLADYLTLGVTGVTAVNLAAVNARVDALTGPDVDTQPEVQALVDAVNAAQAKIVAYATSNTHPAPTLTDYETLGVTGVTPGNLEAVNARVDGVTGPDVDTRPEVQALVDGVAAAQSIIVAYADNSTQPAPALTDYAAMGITGVTAANLAAVNAQVDRLSGTDVDTPAELQAVVNSLMAAQAKIVAYANSNTNPAPTLLDYQAIGVAGVTSSNLALVNAKVDALSGADVDTPPEVQALIDAAVKTLEYTLRRSADGRYHVYLRPTASSTGKPSLSGQVTLMTPHNTGDKRFVVSGLQSAVAGVSWEQNSRADAPVENGAIDYLSFTFSPSGTTGFNWQAGVEQEVFSFLATNECSGSVKIMTDNDPFNQLPNSANTSPGNQFTHLGWGDSATNNYLGNYGAPVDCANALTVQVRGFLQGAFLPNLSLMQDALRTTSRIPTAQPYGVAPFNYAGTETLQPALLSVSDTTAVVDWVLVELRDKNAPATRVAAKAALLRRDGAVVDAQTGSSTLSFPSLATDHYYIVLRHRNHLGVMSKTALALNSNPTLIDFTLPATETYGDAARTGSGGVALLWAGDANGDNKVIANGPGNDLNFALTKVLSSPENTQLNVNYLLGGYDGSDFNISGETIFAGPNNDANIVIGNILLHPQNSSFSGNFIINGTVP